MSEPDPELTVPPVADERARRNWRSGDRAKVSIMNVFRAAHRAGDGRKATPGSEDGTREITARSLQRRDGVGEEMLRAHLQADLHTLLNTTRLESAVSLKDAPHVARSVLNYGFQDLSGLTMDEIGAPHVEKSIRQSLLDHEPRIIPSTLDVKIESRGNDTDQRLSLHVSAELMNDPVDIALDFDAVVDLGAGKLHLSQFRVQT
ncbi:type VI secretion system baseplate subunit TssE [Jannaschia pohangensis]|uniref:Gene 25-like lysozyme n=1 Tax=Jannaschia pohangensis TaxID=390807 RepID=A0A1I3UP44_9RHOB|nr:type VI secretion system baseplate subunit TssE [Jannaschia pohangensis]SFJ83527.1 Gene 25-like lysozyme [Jannaschia pohangensis]